MYRFYARVNLATVVEKPLGPGFSLDAAAILSERAKLTALCQPNNPTGNLFDRREVARVLSESEGVVLLDEAYGDFCGSDMLSEALSAPCAVDTRTLSKAYGMAGLRAGFAVARRDVVDELRRVRTPFGLNSFTEAVAVRALDNRRWVDEKVAEMRVERDYLGSRMRALGFSTYPSECNYITAKCPGKGPPFVAALRGRGVAVRDCSSFPMLEDHIRVTVGPRWMMDKFVAEAEALIQGDGR
jgi:histidinol-phosphate aminotransferase